MIVNRYEEKKNIKHFLRKFIPDAYFEFKINKQYKNRFLDKYDELENADLPYTIQIETINRCNGTCSFCPVNKYVDTRKMVKMDYDLYIKIIDELVKMNYMGRIALFSNNEPLLDNRILEFAKIARGKLPNAFIYIYTNGTLMSKELCVELAKYMDQIIIDNYNNELELNANIYDINELCKENIELDKKVQIHLRKMDEVLYSRGGASTKQIAAKTARLPVFSAI